MKDLNARIEFVGQQLLTFDKTLYIAYSGGKDSSAVTKLVLSAARKLGTSAPQIEIVYCDTGVENPIIDDFTKLTLAALDREFESLEIKARTRVICPAIDQSFFVRLIGRGYPPPTTFFRWCTKDLRIRPFQRFLSQQNGPTIIAVGTRIGESVQRDRSLKKSSVSGDHVSFFQKQRDGFSDAILFTPIIDFDLDDVWNALCSLDFPTGIDVDRLATLYKDGGAECPAIRDFKDKPCSRARFGCWTCTAVRRDKSAENMVAQGYDDLRPLLEFREWLQSIRNQPIHRCRHRRNGVQAPGPFTLAARAMIFQRLTLLEVETGREWITEPQKAAIFRLWEMDRTDDRFNDLQ